MNLDAEKARMLIQMIRATHEDEMACEECLHQVAEFADTELKGRPIGEALQRVRDHLARCSCCSQEYQALLDALSTLPED